MTKMAHSYITAEISALHAYIAHFRIKICVWLAFGSSFDFGGKVALSLALDSVDALKFLQFIDT